MPFGWVLSAALAALVTLFWAWLGGDQPLWVDELHTSWVVSDGFERLADRAAAGNQSVCYFWLVFGFCHLVSTVGSFLPDGWLSTELSLRLPSMIAWSLSMAFVVIILLGAAAQQERLASSSPEARTARSRLWQGFPIAGWCLSILFDRLQWFYGAEARVYSFVQLLSLVGWMIIASIVYQRDDDAANQRQSTRSQVWGWGCWLSWAFWGCGGWTVVAIALIHLHITSLSSVLAQLTVLCLVSLARPRMRLTVAGCGVLLLGAGWMLLGDLHPVWDRRMQWQSVGGNASFSSLVTLLPLLPSLVPVLIAGIACQLRKGIGRYRLDAFQKQERLWAVAFVVPLLVAWAVTRLEIAPLFHYRFVITAALPLAVFAGYRLIRLPSNWIRWSVVLTSILWLAASQGTLGYWQRGQLMGENRSEDWRQAVDYVSQRLKPNQDTLWCSSGLIEGQAAIPPLSELENEYLSYPLRGCYQVVSHGKRIEPGALVGQSIYWAEQLGVDRTDGKAVGSALHLRQLDNHSPMTDPSQSRGIWIICRGSAMGLEKRLQQAGLNSMPRSYPIIEFGRVSVVCLEAPLPSQ